MWPAQVMSDLRQIFDSYSRMTVKGGLTFDGIGGQNVIMDISEVGAHSDHTV